MDKRASPRKNVLESTSGLFLLANTSSHTEWHVKP